MRAVPTTQPADGSSGGASAGHDGAHHGGGHGVSPINMSTILAFVTWFGGAGYVLRVYGGITGALSLVGAGLAGLVGGAIIFYFLARVLLPNQRFLDPADFQMEGTVGQGDSADQCGQSWRDSVHKGGQPPERRREECGRQHYRSRD